MDLEPARRAQCILGFSYRANQVVRVTNENDLTRLPLTAAQQEIWLAHQRDSSTNAYNGSDSVQVRGHAGATCGGLITAAAGPAGSRSARRWHAGPNRGTGSTRRARTIGMAEWFANRMSTSRNLVSFYEETNVKCLS